MSPASQDFRDGAAYGAQLVAERLVSLDIWEVKLSVPLFRQLAAGVRSEMGGILPDSIGTDTRPIKPRCSAHGAPRCALCVRSKSLDNIDEDGNCKSCFGYGNEGMHGDTCEYRVR